ncbi:MAG: plasmid pRiA4b ORF-3 family protein [Gemmatimonadales bacterium]
MDATRRTLQIKVVLRDVEPPVWRRIEVPATYTFWDLHVAIQDAMGWKDCHLHAFRIRNPQTGGIDEVGIPDPDGFEPVFLAGWGIPAASYLLRAGDQAEYEYDFGDSWVHHLVLEGIGIRHAKTKYPRCTDGARACPPEDCGGAHGYATLLAALADRSHEEHEAVKAWVGGHFEPEAFDPRRVRFDNPKKRWRIAFADE